MTKQSRGGDAQVIGHREDDRIGQRAGASGDAVVRAEGLIVRHSCLARFDVAQWAAIPIMPAIIVHPIS